MTALDFKGGAARTALAGPISNSATSFSVAAGGGSGYPDGTGGNFVVALDMGLAGEEKILCSARSTDTFTVASGGRGYDDTAASAHSNLATVDHVFPAIAAREANQFVKNGGTLTALTAGSKILVLKAAASQSANPFELQDSTTAVLFRLASNGAVVSETYACVGPGAAGAMGAGAMSLAVLPRTTAGQGILIRALPSQTGPFIECQASDGTPVFTVSAAGVASTTSAAASAAKVATEESTASTSYTNLTTSGPAVTVTVGASGTALVTMSALMYHSQAQDKSFMGFAVSGASTVAATDADALMLRSSDAGQSVQASYTTLVTGLTPGSTTFTAKYRGDAAAAFFKNRQVIVIPQ